MELGPWAACHWQLSQISAYFTVNRILSTHPWDSMKLIFLGRKKNKLPVWKCEMYWHTKSWISWMKGILEGISPHLDMGTQGHSVYISSSPDINSFAVLLNAVLRCYQGIMPEIIQPTEIILNTLSYHSPLFRSK